LGPLEPGERVNLELPLRAGDRLGGHIVQGHVDGTAEVLAVEDDGFARRLRARVDPGLLRYVVEKGSIALDGVSLTVSALGEDRENEGDLVMAAQFATPEAINFMAKEARGLICLALTGERCEQLGLRLMAAKNEAPLQTAFTVTIEAAEGVSTGISAHDRAHT